MSIVGTTDSFGFSVVPERHQGEAHGTVCLIWGSTDRLLLRRPTRQACACSTFGVIFVRLGPAEIRHKTIAQILGDVAARTGDRFSCGKLISRDQLTPFFGVELSRNFGRA